MGRLHAAEGIGSVIEPAKHGIVLKRRIRSDQETAFRTVSIRKHIIPFGHGKGSPECTERKQCGKSAERPQSVLRTGSARHVSRNRVRPVIMDVNIIQQTAVPCSGYIHNIVQIGQRNFQSHRPQFSGVSRIRIPVDLVIKLRTAPAGVFLLPAAECGVINITDIFRPEIVGKRPFVDNTYRCKCGILRPAQPRIRIYAGQQIFRILFQIPHDLFVDQSKGLELPSGNRFIRETPDLPLFQLARHIQVNTDIKSVSPAGSEEIIQTVHFLRIKCHGLRSSLLRQISIEMMETDKIIAVCGKPFHNTVNLFVRNKNRTAGNINAPKTDGYPRTFLKFKILSNGFQKTVFSGRSVQQSGKIQSGTRNDILFQHDRAPLPARLNQQRINRNHRLNPFPRKGNGKRSSFPSEPDTAQRFIRNTIRKTDQSIFFLCADRIFAQQFRFCRRTVRTGDMKRRRHRVCRQDIAEIAARILHFQFFSCRQGILRRVEADPSQPPLPGVQRTPHRTGFRK